MRIFIVTFITCLTFFLSFFPVFATGGMGEESFSSDASSSSSVSKRARSSSLPLSSSAAALPGLQTPALRAPVFGGVGSSSSAIPAVLPPLSVGSPFSIESLGALLNQVLSPVTATLTTLMGKVDNLGERLEKMEGRLERLENVENGGLETKALALPPELVAKVAAAVENRKLTETQDSKSELFTSDELTALQRVFYDNYDLKHLDIYNICLLFLSLNIRMMHLDFHQKHSFNYRLLFCLLEHILSDRAGATEFQRAKGEILHCALVLFNQDKDNKICATEDEEKWFYRGYLERLNLQGRLLTSDERQFHAEQQKFYFKKLLAQAFQEPNDLLWQYLALEACFYVALHVYPDGTGIILDEEFIEKALKKAFGTYDEQTADGKRIFELLSAKIVRFFHYEILPGSDTKRTAISLNMPSMNMLLKRRIALARFLLNSVEISIDSVADFYDDRHNPEKSNEKTKFEEINKRARDYFWVLPTLFEKELRTNLMNLSDFPELDRAIVMYVITKNTSWAQGYYLEMPLLGDYIRNFLKEEEEEQDETPLLYLSSLITYFDYSAPTEAGEKRQYFVEKMNLLQKYFEEDFEKFEKWQQELQEKNGSLYFFPRSMPIVYRASAQILFYKVHYNSFTLSAQEFERNILLRVRDLWRQVFSGIYSNRMGYREKQMLGIYAEVLIESIVTMALLSYKEKGNLPDVSYLLPWRLELPEFRRFLEQHWASYYGESNKYLSAILHLLYPKYIRLKDIGLQNDMSLEDIREYLKDLSEESENPRTRNYYYLKKLIEEYLNSAQ